MKKEDLIKLGLSEDLAAKAVEAFNGELKGYIPKERFDEVNNLKRQLEKEINEKDTQIENLKNTSEDIEGLKNTISLLEQGSEKQTAEFESKLKNIKKENAIEKGLTLAGAKNLRAVRALMSDFLETAQLEGDSIIGFDNEIERLTTGDDSKFLFDCQENQSPKFRGIVPADKKDGIPQEAGTGSLADAVKLHFGG